MSAHGQIILFTCAASILYNPTNFQFCFTCFWIYRGQLGFQPGGDFDCGVDYQHSRPWILLDLNNKHVHHERQHISNIQLFMPGKKFVLLETDEAFNETCSSGDQEVTISVPNYIRNTTVVKSMHSLRWSITILLNTTWFCWSGW